MLLSSIQLSTVLNNSPGKSDKSGTSSVRDNPGSQSCFFADPKINKGNIIFQYNYFKLYIYIIYIIYIYIETEGERSASLGFL